jgi:hypothetical protein
MQIEHEYSLAYTPYVLIPYHCHDATGGEYAQTLPIPDFAEAEPHTPQSTVAAFTVGEPGGSSRVKTKLTMENQRTCAIC